MSKKFIDLANLKNNLENFLSEIISPTFATKEGVSKQLGSHTVKSDVPENAVFTDTKDWESITGKPDSFSPSSHGHTISEITGLQDTLDDKANSDHTHDDRYYTESEINTKLNSKLNTSLKGSANGLAELDANGKVLSSQLPSFVDDIIEGYLSGGKFYKESAHTTEITGETGKIYIDLATNKTYRWSGSAFVVVSETLALGETSSTAYRGDRGKTAYDHSQSTHARTDATKVEKSSTNGNIKINGTETTVYTHPSGTNPHGTTKSDVGLGNVGNFKAVSTVANQGLTEAEKSNARANIGAGVSSFSGSYNDLTNKPTIPTVGNGTVTIKQAGTSKGTFTMNQSGNTTIELTDSNTTYGVATSSALGLVKSGTDITVDSSGNVSVNDDSHNHVISNVDGLQSALNAKKPSEPTTFSLQKDYVGVRTANRTANQYYEFWDGGDAGWANIQAGSITAHGNFIGNLSGNAATASSVPWSGITGKPSTFTPASHTHNYLPLSGGTVTGATQFNNYLKLNAWSGYGTGTANFWHDANNKFVEIQNVTDLKLAGTKVSKEGHTHTELMSKNNPTGTGSFSLNRKAGSIVGDYSHAEGYNTVASEDYSHAEGRETDATGYYSHAEGCSSLAKGDCSHAEGHGTRALKDYSHAEGYNTVASGEYSHAEGYYTTAAGSSSVCHAEGYKTLASGRYSHAEGYSTNSYGKSSHAEGEYTIAKGIYSHAEGYRTNSYGDYSHAEGCDTNATVESSHAEGTLSLASGNSAHAEGYCTTAGVAYSHAEGYYCSACGSSGNNDSGSEHAGAHAGGNRSTAGGLGSFAHGNYVVSKDNQLVIGHYNKRGSSWKNGTGWYSGIYSGTGTSTAFLIGNGTSSSQSNAMRADYNGKLWCLQAYSATGADYAELFEWEDGNKNNEDRRGYFVTLDGINIKKATSTDDYILGVISAAPTVIGNGDDEWSGRYLRDKFGSFITVKEQEEKIVTDNYIDENGDMQTSERVVTYEYEHYKENPEYDPNREYVDRIHRPEWDAVGMMGVLIVRQDGTAIVNKYVCSNDEGIATLCEKKECSYRVVEVIDNETIKILIK